VLQRTVGPQQPPPLPKRSAPSITGVRPQSRIDGFTQPNGAKSAGGTAEAVAEGLKRLPSEPIPVHFDGVEISARADGRLVDIAVLRRSGEEYILGHRTPQGAVAPARCHLGLRLVRINPDDSVDLVFRRTWAVTWSAATAPSPSRTSPRAESTPASASRTATSPPSSWAAAPRR
jgi:hypothetical protein